MTDKAAEEASTRAMLDDAGWSVRARVRAFWEGGQATYWLGPSGHIAVGRSGQCELRIRHSSVSRRHAMLHGGNPVSVQDLDSANGVRVRGARIPPGATVPVFSGDVIELGCVLIVIQQPPDAHTDHGAPPDVAPPLGATLATPMEAVTRLIERVAKSDLNVLILGETGVGKTLAAQALHRGSPRARAPFMWVNCLSFP